MLGTSYRVGARVTRALPSAPRYALAGAGGSLWYLLSPAQRRSAVGNYAAVLGLDREHPDAARVARRAFANYGRMLADFVLIGSLGREELVARVTVDGREHLDTALAAGRGVLMAVPHMGSWDMGGSFAGSMGYRMSTVATRFPGSLDAAVAETRQALGLRVIPLERAAVKAIGDELAANAVVALLCDLPHGPGIEVDFFGHRAVVPPGAASFAARTGAVVLPACVWRSAPGRYHVHIEPPLEPPAAGKQAARDLMQSVVRHFEQFIRPRPDQWYAFRPLFNGA